VSGVLWKMVPTASVMQYAISAISMFFPVLGAALMAASKMFL